MKEELLTLYKQFEENVIKEKEEYYKSNPEKDGIWHIWRIDPYGFREFIEWLEKK